MSQPTILYFTGAHCPTCKVMGPSVRKVAEDYEGRVDLLEVDVAKNRDLVAEHSVRGVPTMLAISNGAEVGRSVGALSPKAISGIFDGAAAGEIGRLAISPSERALRLVAAFGVAGVAEVAAQPVLLVVAGALGIYALWDLLLPACRFAEPRA
jgi:thioredoxin-like negative regulator of GroEL